MRPLRRFCFAGRIFDGIEPVSPAPLQGHKDHLLGLFDWLVPVSLRFVRRDLKEAAPTLDGQLVTALMRNITAMTSHFVDAAAFVKLVRGSACRYQIS